MWGSTVFLGFLSVFVGYSSCKTLEDFQNCCHVCNGNQQSWISAEPTWQLLVQGSEDLITNFQTPAAYITDNTADGETTLFGRKYHLHYAGVPVYIEYEDGLSNVVDVLNGQYIQVNLEQASDVSAVTVQGGYYGDHGNELFDRKETWITEFLVSFSVNGKAFSYVKSLTGGTQVYKGNTDATSSITVNLPKVFRAVAIRIHPLTASDQYGGTRDVMARVGVVVCTTGICRFPRINCDLFNWKSWGACSCDDDGCRQTRIRDIAMYPACGGAACDNREEAKTCIPPTPLWQTVLIYTAAGLAGLILLIVLVVVLYKKCKKEPTIVFEKQESGKVKKKRKSKKGQVSDQSVEEENIDGSDTVLGKDEYNDQIEEETKPLPVQEKEEKKEKKKKKKNKKSKTAPAEDIPESAVDGAVTARAITPVIKEAKDFAPDDLEEEMMQIVRDESVGGKAGPDPLNFSPRAKPGLSDKPAKKVTFGETSGVDDLMGDFDEDELMSFA